MEYNNFLVERANYLATITWNRPEKLNPINPESMSELLTILTGLKDDADVHVVVVTGAGRAFCAGADLSTLKGVTDPVERERLFVAQRKRNVRFNARVYETLENLEQVTIAAVNGFCVGGGWNIANCCDFRFATEDARFWFPEVDLGVPLGHEGTVRITRLVGPARAKEIIMTCDRYSARQLEAAGLVHKVTPPGQVLPAAHEFAQKLLSKKWSAISQVKAMVNTTTGVRAAESSIIAPHMLLAAE